MNRERPDWISRARARFCAGQDGEAAAYFVEKGNADKAYEFAVSAARYARWSRE